MNKVIGLRLWEVMYYVCTGYRGVQERALVGYRVESVVCTGNAILFVVLLVASTI